MRLFINLFFPFAVFHLFSNPIYSQIDKFIYRINSDSVSIKQLYKMLPKESSKNIFLLSGTDHRFKAIDSLRTLLIGEIEKELKLDRVYYENTWEHDTLLRKFINGGLHIEDYKDTMQSKYYLPVILTGPDSTDFPYYDDLKREYKQLEKDSYIPFLKQAAQDGYIERLQPIDIGTQTLWLGLFHLIKLTKTLNLNNNSLINNFLDSVRVRNRAEYNKLGLTTDDEHKFSANKKSIDQFIEALKKDISDSLMINHWQSVFAKYFQANAFRQLSIPISLGGKPLTLKEFAIKNSFRDSVLYQNFKFYLPENFRNIAILYSTAHLMYSENPDDFKDVLNDNTKLLGKYLYNDYKPYLRKIALICFKGSEDLKPYKKKNIKKSIEYKLSQKFDLAYIDLIGYKKSMNSKTPFYMRPTFTTFRKLHWENIFDGIIFMKNCYCE